MFSFTDCFNQHIPAIMSDFFSFMSVLYHADLFSLFNILVHGINLLFKIFRKNFLQKDFKESLCQINSNMTSLDDKAA